MKKKSTRSSTVFGILLIFTLLLSGCGGAEETEEPVPTSPPEVELPEGAIPIQRAVSERHR
jgi:hypothetical protein